MDPLRRRCLTAAAFGLVAPSLRAANSAGHDIARARAGGRIDVRQKGARGDGRADDTQAIQSAIDALPDGGGTVVVPAGIYLINPLRSLRLRDRMHLQLAQDAWLVAIPNAAPRAYVLNLHDVEDVEVSGGNLLGERERHRGTEGEWGHGIMVRGAERVTLRDLRIQRCWGDGISIGGISGAQPRPSRDVVVSNVVCSANRRQGLTIGRSRRVRVLRSAFIDTGGVLPGCGIDVEPDPGDIADDILITDCLARGNAGAGIQLYERSRNVKVRGCRIVENRGDGIHVRGARDCVFENNEVNDNGLRGIAIRGESEALRLSHNRFSGNARGIRGKAGTRGKGWLHVDVSKSARAITIERSNQLGP